MSDMTHRQYAKSLRLIADFFEEHEDIALPHDADQFNYYSANSREDAARLTKALGGKTEKQYDGEMFRLRHNFGSIQFDAVFYRRQVCRAVVVGQRVIKEQVPATYTEVERVVDDVKWVCDDPIMEAGASDD